MDQHGLDGELDRLRRQGRDDGTIEVKACGQALGNSVWESTSAFANTSGGILLLGLSEPGNFAPVPDFDPDRVVDQFVTGVGDGNPGGARLTNPPIYRIFRLEDGGRPVVVIEIAENEVGAKPCFISARGPAGGSYKRVDDKDIRLSPTELFELQNTLQPSTADRNVVEEASIEDLDSGLVDALITAKRDRERKALRGITDRHEALNRLNVINASGHVRLAGLLVLGSYPQQFAPRLIVDVTVHPTIEKSAPGQQLRFFDREQCEGPLAEVVADAVAAVSRNLRTYSIVEGAGRRDELEIPVTAIREAVANAVLHREYHGLFQGQPVTVDVYPDRIVVVSPGGLWGGKTLETLADGISRCRNQTLLQLLQDVPLSSGAGAVVEGQGGGIQLMINEMAAHALERPAFFATADQVRVELRRHGTEVPEHRAWLRSITSRALTAHEDAALIIARRDGTIDVETLRDALGVDSDVARTMLRRLASDGLLRTAGSQSYHILDRAPHNTGAEQEILEALSISKPMDIHALAQATGRQAGAVRPILRRLVASGRVLATAPPSSRNRRYLKSR